MPEPSPWWTPAIHADRRPFLLARGRIAARLRQWFAERDFFEVETGILQPSPGNETHLHAFATELRAPDGTAARRYLRTSPEFACKKLLAAGERRIFDFARVFRNRERTALHAPEFTLLEWYRANEPYEVLMQDCAAMLALGAEGAASTRLSFRGRSIDPTLPPERLTVAEAFQRHAGIDLLATLFDTQTDRDALAGAAEAAGVQIAADDTWGDIFSRVLVEKIEPELGNGRATILDEYPAVLSALARPSPSDPRVAERFELYACGVELANGFGELNDPMEQRRRLQDEMAEKERLYGESYPLDEDGIALGFDRLVMLASGAARIDQVLWTPPAEPAG
jgi:elongation factor P--(R)-beta-lysine ligase